MKTRRGEPTDGPPRVHVPTAHFHKQAEDEPTGGSREWAPYRSSTYKDHVHAGVHACMHARMMLRVHVYTYASVRVCSPLAPCLCVCVCVCLRGRYRDQAAPIYGVVLYNRSVVRRRNLDTTNVWCTSLGRTRPRTANRYWIITRANAIDD